MIPDQSGPSENAAILPFDNGEMNLKHWAFDDIRLSHAQACYRDYGSHTASNERDVVRMHYGLKGDYSFSYSQLGQSFELQEGHHNIMYSDGFEIAIHNKSLSVETFGIEISKPSFIRFAGEGSDALKRFCDRIMNGENTILSAGWPMLDFRIRQVIGEILNCGYHGGLKKLFLLSKSLELLVLQAKAFEIHPVQPGGSIASGPDREKLMAARDILDREIQSPPSLSELARQVGLNEYKLKKGFKGLFHTTAFGYLARQRLHLALSMLMNTRRTAGEIAYELGYSSPQHFNNAFKKQFGATPKNVRQNPSDAILKQLR